MPSGTATPPPAGTVRLGPMGNRQWPHFQGQPQLDQPAKIEQIFVRIVPDDAAQEAAILAGDSDIGAVPLFRSDREARSWRQREGCACQLRL